MKNYVQKAMANLQFGGFAISLHGQSVTPGSTYCGPFIESPPLVLDGLADTTIRGLSITNPSGHCIKISNSSNVIIENCVFKEVGFAVLALHRGGRDERCRC